MFHKHHFLSLLALLSVLGIFFGGYFDGYYMKFVKILLVVSVLFDVAWFVISFNVNFILFSNTGVLTLKLNTLHCNGPI